jgi:hypothetical protein
MHMPVLQMPALRMQILTKVNERGSAQDMARSGYIDVVGGQSNPVLLNVSAISVHPTMCTSPMTLEQLMLSQEGVSMFEFPATTYEVKAQEHLGLAVTMYINRSKDSVQHSVASIAYVNFDQIMSGAGVKITSLLNDVNKTPVILLLQGLITPQQQMWNQQNAPLLNELCSSFNSITRIEERLYKFSEERMSALTNFLDPHNKDNVHKTLSMPSNLVRHVMNIDVADNAQTEFFKQACCEECPDFLMKYAPLSAAMLLTTAVKFLKKDKGDEPISYKAIAEKLSNMRWTHEDAELWTQIFCNCLTSIVPASNTYTGDASWLVNSHGAQVIPSMVGEEQLLLGSPAIQAVQDIQECEHLSGMCKDLFSMADLQKSELAFRAAHEARLKTCELCKKQDCEDFAADMRNYLCASTHASVMTTTANHMIGTPLLCSDSRLNLLHNTVQDAQQALLACCATQRHVQELTQYLCQDCVCIATAANLTSKYGVSLDEKPAFQFSRDQIPDRDQFLLKTTPGAAGHCCRVRVNSTLLHTLELENDVKVHVHSTDILCMQESTSSTIFRETTEPAEHFDVTIQVGVGSTRTLNGMSRSLVRNVTGSIYGDMLTNSGLSASHAADRNGTKDFYKLICAVGGHSLLAAEKGISKVPLPPAEVLNSMLKGCKETQYYFGVENTGQPMLSLQFELKQEEENLLRLLARANAPLYVKSMQLILASGTLGSCFLPSLQNISSHLPGNLKNNKTGNQLFVVAQKMPLLPMTDVLKSTSVNEILQKQKERVCTVLKNTCKSEFDFYSDHISTDIMLLHTHLTL